MGSAPWWLPWVMYAPLGAVGLAWASLTRDDSLRAPGTPWLSEDPQQALLMGLGLACAVSLLTIWSTRFLVLRTRWARALHLLLRTPLVGESWQRLGLLAVLSAVGEELFFRAALQPTVGLATASLAFGLVHISPRGTGLAWTLWACLMGLIFGALFEASGSVLVPIAAHALINHANMQYIRRFDPTLPDTKHRHPHTHAYESRGGAARDA